MPWEVYRCEYRRKVDKQSKEEFEKKKKDDLDVVHQKIDQHNEKLISSASKKKRALS
jgi:hypothetical protein